MSVAAGTHLGRYEISSMLGAGGMGEVYLARDPKINRDVAIKVLPAAFSADSERLRRFERVRSAGGLRPNIPGFWWWQVAGLERRRMPAEMEARRQRAFLHCRRQETYDD